MGATADPAGKGDGEARELREVILAALHDAWIAGGGAIQQTDALLVALPRNGFEVAPAGTTDALAAERAKGERHADQLETARALLLWLAMTGRALAVAPIDEDADGWWTVDVRNDDWQQVDPKAAALLGFWRWTRD